MVDIKKFGWSVSKKTLQKVVECVLKKYPHEMFQRLYHGIENTYLVHETYGGKTTRGGVLGMQDHLFSFYGSCLFDYMVNTYNLQGLKAKFRGDDSYIFVPRDFHLSEKEVMKIWLELLIKSGIIINAKKTIIGENCGLFCENYGKIQNINCKIAELLLNGLDVLRKDIFSAKQYIASWYPTMMQHYKVVSVREHKLTSLFKDVVSEVIDSFGYEFDPIETHLPFELGGWFRTYVDGMNNIVNWVKEKKDFLTHHINPGFLNIPFVKQPVDFIRNQRVKTLKEALLQLELGDFLVHKVNQMDKFLTDRSKGRAKIIMLKARQLAFKNKNRDIYQIIREKCVTKHRFLLQTK